jgi:hypothetical protein
MQQGIRRVGAKVVILILILRIIIIRNEQQLSSLPWPGLGLLGLVGLHVLLMYTASLCPGTWAEAVLPHHRLRSKAELLCILKKKPW